VFLTRGRTGQAHAFLEDVADTWTNLYSFKFSHAWRHVALVVIDQNDRERIGAVSLLARLEPAGVDAAGRRVETGCDPWRSGHLDHWSSTVAVFRLSGPMEQLPHSPRTR
jgi:hypothetical protein